MRRSNAPLLSLFLCTVGCGGEPLIARTDLASALGGRSVEVHGVTVEPKTGRRFILDPGRGLFLELDGVFTPYAAIAELTAEGHEPLSAFTDLAALGDDQFALIAKNDGFLFDRRGNTFRRHFCYLPGDIEIGEPQPIEPAPDPIDPGEEYFQLANNLAYDAIGARIIAQPQTFAEDDSSLLSAHIGTFARNDGNQQTWFELPNAGVDAGGLAVFDEDRILLGWGTALWRFTFSAGVFERVGELTNIVTQVDGLAWDPNTETVLIVDDATKELVEVDLEALLP